MSSAYVHIHKRPMNRFLNNLAESLASTWRLLSDTTNFLSRARLLGEYEQELAEMRARLYRYRRDQETIRQVREQIVALRRELRARGFDLRLGSRDITLEGFRHDDAMGEGFRRLVLGITDDDVVALAGDLNHNELAEMLESRLRGQKHRRPDALRLHFLWYRWRNQVLVLSGAASETAQAFEELKAYFTENKEFLLRKLARL
jgi:hypothetical protein